MRPNTESIAEMVSAAVLHIPSLNHARKPHSTTFQTDSVKPVEDGQRMNQGRPALCSLAAQVASHGEPDCL